MPEHVVLRRIVLKHRHQSTGNTRHYRDGRELPAPAALEIARYAGDAGFYLFYLDAAGDEITDTYHESMEDAVSQAEWEFVVGEVEWLLSPPEQPS